VLCITGNGLKTLDAIADSLPEAPVIAPRLGAVAALVDASAR
jgi:threonine synthase